MTSNKIHYYNIKEDLVKYPDAWCYVIIGGRARGKTYSTLLSCLQDQRDFIFLKRTIDDVELLTSGAGKVGSASEIEVELSPFKAINRDHKTDIHAYSIKRGLGGFWVRDPETGKASGAPVGYLLALNAVTKYKGFELASGKPEQWLIFDEFIPNIYDRVNRREGEQLLDLYMTVSRDREARGLQPLKLILLANATSINNPVMSMLEIVDTVAAMQAGGEHELYIQDRGIYVNQIADDPGFSEVVSRSSIYKAMNNTQWGRMSFDNVFAYNDFSAVGKINLKGFRPFCRYVYKNQCVYIYVRDGYYYACSSQHNSPECFDLEKENDQKLFWLQYAYDLRIACIEHRMLFETYTMYDLIVNYRKVFHL